MVDIVEYEKDTNTGRSVEITVVTYNSYIPLKIVMQ